MKLRVGSLLVCLCLLGSANAHDYWLKSSSYFIKPGGEIMVRLFVGDNLEVSGERSYQQDITLRFDHLSPKGRKDIRSQCGEGDKPILKLRPTQAGSHLLVMDRDFREIELSAEKFNLYLKHEGLDHILKLREQSGEAGNPAKERYARYLKCLFQVGDKQTKTVTEPVGQRLEIVPLVNPLGKKKGDTIRARVLFDKKPLADVAVFALHQAKEKIATQALRTDDKGEVTVKLTGSGFWLIRLVHMQRAPNPKEADWESHWSALSFAIPE